jgi:hypothetical protein
MPAGGLLAEGEQSSRDPRKDLEMKTQALLLAVVLGCAGMLMLPGEAAADDSIYESEQFLSYLKQTGPYGHYGDDPDDNGMSCGILRLAESGESESMFTLAAAGDILILSTLFGALYVRRRMLRKDRK